MKLFSILVLSLFASFQASAQIQDAYVQSDTRYDGISDTASRLQQRVRIGFTIDAKGYVQLVGVLATGPSFGNDWASIVNFNSANNDKINVAFRNFYLHREFEHAHTTVDFGALNPEGTVGSAGIGSSGWMDGLRVDYKNTFGEVKVVAGAINHDQLQQPNAFARQFTGNFLEVEMSKQVLDDLLLKAAYERLDHDDYFRTEGKYDIHFTSNIVFSAITGFLYDFEKQGLNADIGVKTDLLRDITNRYQGRLNFSVYYSHLDSKMSDRSALIPAFFTNGSRISYQFDGKINRSGTITWFLRGSNGQKSRYDAGIAARIGIKK